MFRLHPFELPAVVSLLPLWWDLWASPSLGWTRTQARGKQREEGPGCAGYHSMPERMKEKQVPCARESPWQEHPSSCRGAGGSEPQDTLQTPGRLGGEKGCRDTSGWVEKGGRDVLVGATPAGWVTSRELPERGAVLAVSTAQIPREMCSC